VPLSALATRVSERLPKGEGASSALRNLSQAVYGLAHRAPTILGHTREACLARTGIQKAQMGHPPPSAVIAFPAILW